MDLLLHNKRFAVNYTYGRHAMSTKSSKQYFHNLFKIIIFETILFFVWKSYFLYHSIAKLKKKHTLRLFLCNYLMHL